VQPASSHKDAKHFQECGPSYEVQFFEKAEKRNNITYTDD